jgi:hypothetical protein
MALPRRRPSVAAATKLTVNKHTPWPLRLAGVVLAAIIGAGLAVWGWQAMFGNAREERSAMVAELEGAKLSLDKESTERKRLAAIVNAADSNLKVEQSTVKQLSDQVKSLEAENAKLKADLSYFERLLPSGGQGEMISIRSLEVLPDTVPNQLRYRALVVQGGREEKNFQGALQVVMTLVSEGKPLTLVVPDPKAAEAKQPDNMKLNFTRYLKVDGQVEIPAGSTLKTFQLRVLERGAVRAQQAISR